MAARKNLTESECLELIQFVSETLLSNNNEYAVSAIVEELRVSFGASCVSIREILSRPYSLRYTYESLKDPTKVKRINETVTFDEELWQSALDRFAQGCYIYRAGTDQRAPKFIGPVHNCPQFMIQMPMYCDNDFFGVLDIVDFEEIRELTDREISTLGVCANLICQYLYRVNSAFSQHGSSDDTDPLTGLINFRTFTERLDEKLSDMLSDSPVVVVYTDIHHFKYINETYGYKKGDELLKLTAQAMTGGADGKEIMICRAHADNFVTAATIPEELMSSFADFIHEQNDYLSQLLQEHCPDVVIRLNTGICYVKDPSTTSASAIANANLARKVAKRNHMRTPLIFSEEMMEDIKYQEYLNNELPKAIENNELKVYYQPKINCADDSLYGAEALVRWQKADGTFIYPDKFIPVFEKNGNIVDVDFYVYREVFKYIRKRLDAGLPVFPISMNVSRVHLRYDRIIPYIEELLAEYRIPPELVEFELTENIYMQNFSKADEFIKNCRKRGMLVSMDDFGSGYSSLNVISSLSIDTLKIDRIFLQHADLSENDKTVIGSMIAMAKHLGMKVICEGVETESQTLFLKDTMCDQIQGYYYGKPMDEKSFDTFANKLLNV